jgi:hypothetical protein
MPRIRTVKPEHWNDKELVNISLQAHLLWIALWNFSDDEGVFENDSNLIRSQVFPRRADIRLEQITEWLGQLVKARFIVPFEYKNESYYIHRTFKTHQRIDKPQPSKIPSEIILRLISESSRNDQGSIPPYSKGKEGKGEYDAREVSLQEVQKILLAEEKWVENMKTRHKGKSLQQAIAESYDHMKTMPHRFNSAELNDWKRLVQTWLTKMKVAGIVLPPSDPVPRKKVETDDFVNKQLQKQA